MKKIFTISIVITIVCSRIFAQREVIRFEPLPNGMVSLNSDLSQGEKMPDLSWAWNSQNACFIATQQSKFTGNHVLFQTEIPARSEMTIRVVPTDRQADFSIYAYSGGGGAVVPDLPVCVSCEADYKWDFKYLGKSQDHTRSVQLRAIQRSYPVTIGVVGSQGLSSGEFTLEVELVGGEVPQNKLQEAIPVFKVESQRGQSLVYQGDLAQGVLVHDLSWAWNSQNACFPATVQTQFKGHHQLYLTELPGYSELSITLVTDDPKLQLNLYAYSLGANLQLVPNLGSCVSCEADYPSNYGTDQQAARKVQLRALNNPYQVVIGVAGAAGITTGKYQLKLDLK